MAVPMTNAIKVLAVDDSALARNAYRLVLEQDPALQLVATAPNADIARRKITTLDPDVVILDIEMPGEDGLSLLKWLMENFPVPVVVSSSHSARGAEQTMQAFALGAVEVVCKGGPAGNDGWNEAFATTLLNAVHAASRVRRKARFNITNTAIPTSRLVAPTAATKVPAPAQRAGVAARAPIRRGSCVVIGASTGGTEALATLIAQMPADFPPTLIVQHMPSLYTATFARRLDGLGVVRVSEAVNGQMIGPGQVLVAPGGKQLRIDTGAVGPIARVTDEGPHNRHAPSVDVLFHSAARTFRARTLGVLLTGMGNDGAEGLLAIRDAGGYTLAQDEASCVVYGMPYEAVKRNAATQVLPLNQIVDDLVQRLSREQGL